MSATSATNAGSRNPGTRYLIGAIACLSILAAGAIWLLMPQTTRTNPYPLATMTLPNLRANASEVRFGGKRERPLVINFFFSDCVGCVTELPRIEAAAKKWTGQIDIVGVDHFEPRASGADFAAKTGITFPVGWDQTGEFAPLVGVNAFPATLFVDKEGIVRRRVLGQISEQRLNSELQQLFMSSHVN